MNKIGRPALALQFEQKLEDLVGHQRVERARSPSSQMISVGLAASARAMQTRCSTCAPHTEPVPPDSVGIVLGVRISESGEQFGNAPVAFLAAQSLNQNSSGPGRWMVATRLARVQGRVRPSLVVYHLAVRSDTRGVRWGSFGERACAPANSGSRPYRGWQQAE